MNEISTMLDSGFRRNDGFGCFSDFFSNLLKGEGVNIFRHGFRATLMNRRCRTRQDSQAAGFLGGLSLVGQLPFSIQLPNSRHFTPLLTLN